MTRRPLDRPYPHAVPAERTLLGQILQDPEVLHAIPALRPEHFYHHGHGALFELLIAMLAAGKPINLTTVAIEITEGDGETAPDPDRFGGLGYVTGLPDHVFSTANPDVYADAILRNWKRRELIDAMHRTMDQAYARQGDPDRLTDTLMGSLMGGAIQQESIAGGWHNMQDVLDETMQSTRDAQADPGRHGGISCGFPEIDRHLGNLHPGDLIVLAARPAMGKSALALNIAEAVCTDARHEGHVGFFSLEMGRKQLGRRTLAGASHVSSMPMRTGRLDLRQLDAVIGAHERMRRDLVRLWFDTEAGLTITQIRARARRLQFLTGHLGLIVVDYLQLIGGELGRGASRSQEIGHISRQLKRLAKDLGCPILALSQLNRTCETRPDKRPLVSDLRESGDIEQDADVILLLYRHEVYHPGDRKFRGLAEVNIGKARSAMTGVVPLNYNAPETRFFPTQPPGARQP